MAGTAKRVIASILNLHDLTEMRLCNFRLLIDSLMKKTVNATSPTVVLVFYVANNIAGLIEIRFHVRDIVKYPRHPRKHVIGNRVLSRV